MDSTDIAMVRKKTGWPDHRTSLVAGSYVTDNHDKSLESLKLNDIHPFGQLDLERKLPVLDDRQIWIAIRIIIGTYHTLNKDFIAEYIHRLQLWQRMVAVASGNDELFQGNDAIFEIDGVSTHAKHEILFWSLFKDKSKKLLGYVVCSLKSRNIPTATVSRHKVSKLCSADPVLSRFTNQNPKTYTHPDLLPLVGDVCESNNDLDLQEVDDYIDSASLSDSAIRQIFEDLGIKKNQDRENLRKLWKEPYILCLGKQLTEGPFVPLHALSKRRFSNQKCLLKISYTSKYIYMEIRKYNTLCQ